MKIGQLSQMLFVLVAAAFVYGFVSTAKEGETRRACDALCAMHPHYADYSRRVPDFTLPNLSGKQVSMSDFAGKVVVLNFWSKTCPPCLNEMPTLAQFADSIRGRDDIVLLTITTDESAEDARKTLTSTLGRAPNFEVLIDPESNVVGDLFGTQLYPETWYIDPAGVIVARMDGERDFSSPEALALAESLLSPVACEVRFRDGQPRGPYASLCEASGH